MKNNMVAEKNRLTNYLTVNIVCQSVFKENPLVVV